MFSFFTWVSISMRYLNTLFLENDIDICSGFGGYIFLESNFQALDFIPKHCRLSFSLWSMFLANCDWLLKPVGYSIWNICFSLLWLAIVIVISYCSIICSEVETCTFQYDTLYGQWKCNSLRHLSKCLLYYCQNTIITFKTRIFLWWRYFAILI